MMLNTISYGGVIAEEILQEKICLKIGATTEDDMSWFLSKANKAFITVEWYDAEIKGTRTAQCYSNNLKASLKSKKRMAYSSFEWNLIPLKKR